MSVRQWEMIATPSSVSYLSRGAADGTLDMEAEEGEEEGAGDSKTDAVVGTGDSDDGCAVCCVLCEPAGSPRK